MSRSPRMSLSAAMTSVLMITLMFVGMNLGSVRASAPYDATAWTASHATFYGGSDASGTMGGACGYGNLYNIGFGVNSAALSSTLYNGGQSCGACFEIQCIKSQSKWCYANAGSIKITATNLCPANWARTTDGWCNPPRTHFDLSYPMFAQLAQRVAGIIPVEYRRIPCVRTGGIRFSMSGNKWFNMALVYNVGGGGDVMTMEMKGSQTEFYSMRRNWGAFWDVRQVLQGQALSFRVCIGNGKTLTSTNVAPSNWNFGQSFQCTQNF